MAVAALSGLVLLGTGAGWSQLRNLDSALRRSGDLGALAVSGPTRNILVMGLDSRLDENGNPLPPQVYDALNAGNAADGGLNSNVLIVLHLPGDGSRATAMSIPRDDYVDLPGRPSGTAKGKIKQAYGLAYAQQHASLTAQGVTDRLQLEQRSRDAGRNAEIATVSQFLDLPIDHMVEVTMAAFYQIAQVVQPITVCLAEDTEDDYSGAKFHKGYQQIDAAQAVAFVRQRRDYVHPELNFTDLDRERRQQAFIASLAYQLKQAGTFTDPTRLGGLIDVARQNTAIDPGLDLLSLAQQAAGLAGGNVDFTTLPIERFGKDPSGEDVNIVDPVAVRSTVRTLLDPPAPAPAPASPAPGGPGASRVVDIRNGTRRDGLAAAVAATLPASGDTAGSLQNTGTRRRSSVAYPPGDRDAAAALGTGLGITTTTADRAVPAGHLLVLLGEDYPGPPAAAAPAAGGAAPGADTPDTPDLTTGTVPCVK